MEGITRVCHHFCVIVSLQVLPQVFPQMQSKLFEERWKPEGHATLSGNLIHYVIRL